MAVAPYSSFGILLLIVSVFDARTAYAAVVTSLPSKHRRFKRGRGSGFRGTIERKSGVVIHISSVTYRLPFSNSTLADAAAKGALATYSKGLAKGVHGELLILAAQGREVCDNSGVNHLSQLLDFTLIPCPRDRLPRRTLSCRCILREMNSSRQ